MLSWIIFIVYLLEWLLMIDSNIYVYISTPFHKILNYCHINDHPLNSIGILQIIKNFKFVWIGHIWVENSRAFIKKWMVATRQEGTGRATEALLIPKSLLRSPKPWICGGMGNGIALLSFCHESLVRFSKPMVSLKLNLFALSNVVERILFWSNFGSKYK